MKSVEILSLRQEQDLDQSKKKGKKIADFFFVLITLPYLANRLCRVLVKSQYFSQNELQ
jgi:hypothetical protein